MGWNRKLQMQMQQPLHALQGCFFLIPRMQQLLESV
jgi:hypothetical protein